MLLSSLTLLATTMTIQINNMRLAAPVLVIFLASCSGNTQDQVVDIPQENTEAAEESSVEARPGTIWDGDDKSFGGIWASAAKPDLDSISIDIAAEVGVEGSSAFQIQVAGDNWMGVGYNFLDLWGQEPGLDLRELEGMSFDIRIEGEKLPKDLNYIKVQFTSGGKSEGRAEALPLTIFSNVNFADGDWHTLKVPFEKFVGTNIPGSSPFDQSQVRELSVSVAPLGYVDLDMYIDNIAFYR